MRIVERLEVRCRQRARESCALEGLDRCSARGEIPALPALTPDSPELDLFLRGTGEVNHLPLAHEVCSKDSVLLCKSLGCKGRCSRFQVSATDS